jgi:hypothetical protein
MLSPQRTEDVSLVSLFEAIAPGSAVLLRHTDDGCSRSEFSQMPPFSLPLTVSSLMLFLGRIRDRIVPRSTLGFHEFGVFGVGVRFVGVTTIA